MNLHLELARAQTRRQFLKQCQTGLGSIALAAKRDADLGSRFPAGIALSSDGRLLYVAENLADTLAVVDLASGTVLQRLPAGHYPYAAAAAPSGEVYVSAWGGEEIAALLHYATSILVTVSSRCLPLGSVTLTASPFLRPTSALPTGDSLESRLADGSASVEPTIV